MARGAIVLLCVLDTTLRIRAVAQNGLNATAARADSTVAAFEGVDYVRAPFSKSGGSLRQIVCEAAQRRGWPMALRYDGHAPLLATLRRARAGESDRGIRSPRASTRPRAAAEFAYVSTLRAPAAWLVSDYPHHRSHELARLPTDAPRAAAAVCAWLRAAPPRAPSSRSARRTPRAARGAARALRATSATTSRSGRASCPRGARAGRERRRARRARPRSRARSRSCSSTSGTPSRSSCSRPRSSSRAARSSCGTATAASSTRPPTPRARHRCERRVRGARRAYVLHDAHDAATRVDADLRAARAGELRFEVRQRPRVPIGLPERRLPLLVVLAAGLVGRRRRRVSPVEVAPRAHFAHACRATRTRPVLASREHAAPVLIRAPPHIRGRSGTSEAGSVGGTLGLLADGTSARRRRGRLLGERGEDGASAPSNHAPRPPRARPPRRRA